MKKSSKIGMSLGAIWGAICSKVVSFASNAVMISPQPQPAYGVQFGRSFPVIISFLCYLVVAPIIAIVGLITQIKFWKKNKEDRPSKMGSWMCAIGALYIFHVLSILCYNLIPYFKTSLTEKMITGSFALEYLLWIVITIMYFARKKEEREKSFSKRLVTITILIIIEIALLLVRYIDVYFNGLYAY